MDLEEQTIRGIRVCEYEAMPHEKRGRKKGWPKEYWISLFESLKDHWVNVGDIKKQTTYALNGIRTKARQNGYHTFVSIDKNWLYIKKLKD